MVELKLNEHVSAVKGDRVDDKERLDRFMDKKQWATQEKLRVLKEGASDLEVEEEDLNDD